MTIDRNSIESLFRKQGFEDFKWIEPREIVVAQWVRMKCTYGCGGYAKHSACPPNVPGVEECRTFFSEYTHAVVFHFAQAFANPEDRKEWCQGLNIELLKVEREVFLAGHRKAFLLFPGGCAFCGECAGTRVDCRNSKLIRPTPEALAMDVYATVWKYGLPVQVLTDYHQTMNRYAFLMIE
ncbi:MAG: DUF2284 domain-containing protein [Thermodesulfobacteriota bacterium]